MKNLENYLEKPKKFFQFLFWNFFFGYLPFGLLISFLSLMGKVAFTLNEKGEYGITGFLMYLLTIPFVALILTLVNWLYLTIGNYILNIIFKK